MLIFSALYYILLKSFITKALEYKAYLKLNLHALLITIVVDLVQLTYVAPHFRWQYINLLIWLIM